MLLVGLIDIMSPWSECLCVTLQQDDVTVLCVSPVLSSYNSESKMGQVMPSDAVADSDDPPEPIQKTSSGQ